MDHFLGALLAQNNDQGHELAIYYLSRTLIGPIIGKTDRKGMFGVGVRHPENATLPDGSNHTRHIKS